MEQKKKADAYAKLIAKLDQEEEKTWGSQFITACMLHPTKGDDGEIQDIEGMDGWMGLMRRHEIDDKKCWGRAC